MNFSSRIFFFFFLFLQELVKQGTLAVDDCAEVLVWCQKKYSAQHIHFLTSQGFVCWQKLYLKLQKVSTNLMTDEVPEITWLNAHFC